MLKNWFLIASVTFSVGFGTTLLLSKDAKPAAIAGAAGIPGVMMSVAMLKRQRQEEVEQQLCALRTNVKSLQQQEQAMVQNIAQQQVDHQAVTVQCQEIDRQFAALEMQQQGHAAAVNKLAREIIAKQAIDIALGVSIAEKQANVEALETKLSALHEQQQVASTMLLNQQEIEAEITKFTADRTELIAELAVASASKLAMAASISQLQEYQTEIKLQIADDQEICTKAEEYLQQVDQESQDKREDCQELDILIKAKSSELNQVRTMLAGFLEQKTNAEAAIRGLAIELQQFGDAILEQEDIKNALDSEISQLADSSSAMQQNLLTAQTDLVDREIVAPEPEILNLSMADVPLNWDESTWEQPEQVEIKASVVDFDLQDLDITYLDLSHESEADLSWAESTWEQPITTEAEVDDEFDILSFDITDLDLDSLPDIMEFNIGDEDFSSLEETKPESSLRIDELEAQWTADTTNWAASFVDNPHLQILEHIAEHGSIAHFEAAAMLNNKKVAHEFAEKISSYATMLPFEIEVERSSNGNRYLKKV
jgi:hypothetical protein